MHRLFNLAKNSNDDDEDDFGSVNSSFASQGAGEAATDEVIDEDQETGQEATGQEAAPVVEAKTEWLITTPRQGMMAIAPWRRHATI